MKFLKSAVLLLLCCTLLCACGEAQPSRDSVSIWCLESEPALKVLDELKNEYNSQLPKGSLPVSIRTFPDEDALASGFDAMRPDILLCSVNKAQELSGMGLTKQLGQKLSSPYPRYRDYIIERVPQSGRDIFPLGGDIQLICIKNGLVTPMQKDSFSLELLCELALSYAGKTGLPFFTADSFSSLFYEAMLRQNKEFHALKELDIKNDEFKEIYNLLADGFYSQGVISSQYSSRDLLESAYLPCAAVKSSQLASEELKNFELFPLYPDGPYLAELSAFCVTVREGRSSDSAAEFLSWLFSEGRFDKLTIKSGLVPCVENMQYSAESSFEKLLINTGMLETLHLPENGCDFLMNHGDFEHLFRDLMENLS